MRRTHPGERGFATLMVFAVIALAAIIIGMIQTSAFGQASAGREALARVRAQWAARAGLESIIATLEWSTENPDTGSAFTLMDDFVAVSAGDLDGATYRIATFEESREVLGPADAHSKLNINRLTKDQLLMIEPLMSEDVADSILDWIDADDDTNPLGAEIGYYAGLPFPYEPRNAPMRSILEMELVAGVDPRDVRGEDWNLNGLLDPNEDDGDESWPPDNADGILDRAWSGVLTTTSLDGALAPSGQPKIDLQSADAGELVQRAKVDSNQAQAIVDYVANNSGAAMRDFIIRDLRQLAPQTGGGGGGGQTVRVENLTREQLGLLLDEATVGAPESGAYIPGKLNINTCPAKTLEYLPQITPEVADAIIAERSARPDGFVSLADLLSVPGIGRRQLAAIYELLCVRSNVYEVTCRGRDTRTGIETEIHAVLDRSTMPVVLQEVSVR
ncbi:MAG: general secretion pathway protein GspK [Phycisphaerales bacterium]|nr:general secretion pathway protein GspK [Phycisphaerales bacterium]